MWFIKADERSRRRRGREGRRVKSLFLCLLLLIKESDYTLLACLFILSEENKRRVVRELSNGEGWKRETETVRFLILSVTFVADASALAA